LSIFKKNIFGQSLFLKKWIVRILGWLSYSRFQRINQLRIVGSSVIRDLPESNVLFVANHQTYFADAAAMLHVFNSSLNGNDNINDSSYLWRLKLNIYFVAAKETMLSGWLPKIFSYAGSISVQRTWRSRDENVKRKLNMNDIDNISTALNDGWVVTFPQGTTTPWAPVRKGTAHIIKKNKPLVVPIVIDGFRDAFDKKGLVIRKRGVIKSMHIKDPMELDYDNSSIDDIVNKIEFAIEQHSSFKK
tara:strand:+ start:159 stop:896 length:738 start_codon:yes stop_codon:yes gene_type:complete